MPAEGYRRANAKDAVPTARVFCSRLGYLCLEDTVVLWQADVAVGVAMGPPLITISCVVVRATAKDTELAVLINEECMLEQRSPLTNVVS